MSVHYDLKRRLYIDLDAPNAGVMIYHSKDEVQSPDPLRKLINQPILFLSKLLKGAEPRYWPMELEIASLV